MTAYERKPSIVQAFRVPAWGEKADETPPQWLVKRMMTGEVYINSAGGLSANYVWGTRGCGPGDWIILTEFDEIEFCPEERFIGRYELIQA